MVLKKFRGDGLYNFAKILFRFPDLANLRLIFSILYYAQVMQVNVRLFDLFCDSKWMSDNA